MNKGQRHAHIFYQHRNHWAYNHEDQIQGLFLLFSKLLTANKKKHRTERPKIGDN